MCPILAGGNSGVSGTRRQDLQAGRSTTQRSLKTLWAKETTQHTRAEDAQRAQHAKGKALRKTRPRRRRREMKNDADRKTEEPQEMGNQALTYCVRRAASWRRESTMGHGALR